MWTEIKSKPFEVNTANDVNGFVIWMTNTKMRTLCTYTLEILSMRPCDNDSDIVVVFILELHWLCIRWWFSHPFRVWIVSTAYWLPLLLSQVNWIFFLTEIDRFHYRRHVHSFVVACMSVLYCFWGNSIAIKIRICQFWQCRYRRQKHIHSETNVLLHIEMIFEQF